MKRVYQVTGLVIVAFAVATMHASVKLTYYTKLGPGAGYFPFWVAAIVCALGIAMIYVASTRDAGPLPDDFMPSRPAAIKLVAILAMLVATIIFIDPLGFRVTTFVFFAVLLPVLGYTNPIKVFAVSLIGSVGVFYLFDKLLGVPLPIGLLGF